MSDTSFKGALKAKRKPDLLEIAAHLGLDLADNTKRDDVEAAVRDHLVANRDALAADSRVSGLYSSLDKSERRGRLSTAGLDSESDSNGSPQTSAVESPRKHTRTRQPSRRSEPVPLTSVANGLSQPAAVAEEALVNATSALGSHLKVQTRKSLDNIANVFKSTSAAVRAEANDAVAEADHVRHATPRRTRHAQQAVQTKLRRTFDRARTHASDAGNLVRLLISVEAFFLVLSVLPTHYIRIGQAKTQPAFIRHGLDGTDSPVPHWAITVPDVRGLATLAFWQPLLLWTLWVVALPSLAAHLVTFHRRGEPSPVTFSMTRLALLLSLTGFTFSSSISSPHVPNTLGVAAGQPASAATVSTYSAGLVSSLAGYFSYGQHVPLDSTLQILATALVAGLALYEAVASRPRAA
ncbi:unnamed protein product [Parajaminaea phylloscopi]